MFKAAIMLGNDGSDSSMEDCDRASLNVFNLNTYKNSSKGLH
ncbi:MAG TPA: hypothetical protein V6D28_29005 [Leptolyngbyaceae cyanobacterium]